jgi:hypothetical protein
MLYMHYVNFILWPRHTYGLEWHAPRKCPSCTNLSAMVDNNCTHPFSTKKVMNAISREIRSNYSNSNIMRTSSGTSFSEGSRLWWIAHIAFIETPLVSNLRDCFVNRNQLFICCWFIGFPLTASPLQTVAKQKKSCWTINSNLHSGMRQYHLVNLRPIDLLCRYKNGGPVKIKFCIVLLSTPFTACRFMNNPVYLFNANILDSKCRIHTCLSFTYKGNTERLLEMTLLL